MSIYLESVDRESITQDKLDWVVKEAFKKVKREYKIKDESE